MSRMFPFITKTWSPIAGGFSVKEDKIYACPYRCFYCWANLLINKFPKGNLGKKYTGPYRIHDPAMKPWFKADSFIFVQCMSDIGAPQIPSKIISTVFDKIRDHPDIQFLLLTKSDTFYNEYMHEIPANCVCGITMETDHSISHKITQAPHPLKRLDSLIWLKSYYPQLKTFICIEPIIDFSENFAEMIQKAEPWAVAVGYDNYNMGLPEPSLARTKDFISDLETFTTVHIKSLRDSSPTQTIATARDS